MTRILSLLPAVVLVAAASLPPQASAPAGKPHPRLVKGATTRCATCHQALTQGKDHVHPPVEDCTSCHAVDIGEAGTRVGLNAEGNGLCLTCHDGLGEAAAGTLKSPHAPVTDSCTTCHDPHASAQARLLSAPLAELCASCHDAASLAKPHGGQVTEATNCLRCHAPHGSANPRLLAGAHTHAPFADRSCEACHRPPMGGRTRLLARGDRLCSSCHGDVAKETPGGSVHAALRSDTQASNGCLSCHDPHMSAQKALLVRSGPELCARCHAAVRDGAAAKGGHAPAADDCLSCHRPHSSPQRALLAQPAPGLCLDCHDAESLGKPHLGAAADKLDCLSCHTPHGAGTEHLLARNVHPPVADGCDTCHQGSYDKQVEGGGPALCLACHSDVAEKARAAKVPHAALEAAACVDCHNPHASAQEKLVKSPGAGPCASCHDDRVPAEGEFGHGTIALFGCRSCHEAHGGDQPKLLRAAGDALCLGCHASAALKPAKEGDRSVRLLGLFDLPVEKARAVDVLRLSADGTRGHPTPEHPVKGTAKQDPHGRRIAVTFQGELSCLACHDPHKGRSPMHFRGEAASTTEACLACHPK